MDSYVVQKGDSLASIALHYYGDPSEWRRIYNANIATISDPNVVLVGQRLDIPTEMDCTQQRLMMSPAEQMACPEEGLSYPVELEVLELLVGATALLKGLLKAGVKVFAKKAAPKASSTADDIFKSILDPGTGKQMWPHSPYKNQYEDPRKIQAAINNEIQEKISQIDTKKIGRQNAVIERIHKEFVETGNWPLKNAELGDYSISTPGPSLKKARQDFLDALQAHTP